MINGTKMWITAGSVADVALVWAQTDDGVRGFLVERGTPGFSARDIKHKMSLRASVTSELVLDDVRVPEASGPAGRSRDARTALLSQRGPLWHRVGGPGRGSRML